MDIDRWHKAREHVVPSSRVRGRRKSTQREHRDGACSSKARLRYHRRPPASARFACASSPWSHPPRACFAVIIAYRKSPARQSRRSITFGHRDRPFSRQEPLRKSGSRCFPCCCFPAVAVSCPDYRGTGREVHEETVAPFEGVDQSGTEPVGLGGLAVPLTAVP